MNNFENIKKYLVSEADKAGLEEYEIFFTESESLGVETLKDEISSFNSGVCAGVNFRCVVNGHMGSAGTELLSDAEMSSLVRRAKENALAIESEDKAIIFEGSPEYAKLELPEFLMPSASFIKEKALSIQNKTYDISEFVTDGTQSATFGEKLSIQICNSKGLDLSHTIGMGGMYAVAVVNKDGEAQDGFEAKIVTENWDTDGISEKAVDEAISRIGAGSVSSGKYDVIISGKQMRSLLSTYSSVFSGKKALLGLSLLKGKEGEKIASEVITIVDDPMREGSPVAIAFDGEGVATYRKNVVEKGILKTLLYDLTTADRVGVKTTGNGQRASYTQSVSIAPFSFYIEKGDISFEDMLSKIDDGIYITELKGLHAGANAVTGDFSIESSGYRIKNGKICEAVKGFTVAGNFFELIKKIEEVSNRLDFGIPSGFTTFGAPDVFIKDMSIAGTD